MYRINTFAVPICLLVFRNGTSFYKSLRATYDSNRPSIRPTPPQAARALNVLFTFAIAALAYTLPYFSPENVFQVTNARLQTSNEVIFTRLAAKRPLTDFDHKLKTKINSDNGRLIYCAYGPDTVADCNFCSNDQLAYLYYLLPSLAAPHLLHLLVLGVVTSSFLSGSEGARWRSVATLAGLALAAADLYFNLTHDINANASVTGAKDINFFFWRMRQFRGIGSAAIDGLLGWVMYLASTNRFFTLPPSPAQRIEVAARALEGSNFRLWATGNVRNTVVRDQELREDMTRYWAEEREVFEDEDVVKATQAALERIDMRALNNAAEQRSLDIVNAAFGG